MTNDHLNRLRNLDELYAHIDKDRGEAAKAAHVKFHNDMEAAIATIASIGSIAGARVLADSRVASANVLINAELAATRLDEAASQGEDVAKIIIEAAQEASFKLQEAIKATLSKINKVTNEACSVVDDAARVAEKKIQEGHERALVRLREALQAHL